MTEPVRLAKRLAELVPCSRREAELYIEGGWVTVDGQVIEEPQFRVSQQNVELNPKALLGPVELVTILLHQPANRATANESAVITVDRHSDDDASGIRPLKRHFSRLSPTLPLETNAGGLLVLTQDWRVTRKLVDNAASVEQEYVVDVAGALTGLDLKLFDRKQSLNGRELPPVKVSRQSETRLRFALKGAQPGQIAHLCESAGLQVSTMKRIRIGRVAMAKLLPGQWRYLPVHERF